MTARTELEYTYDPTDLFPRAHELQLSLGSVRIDGGRATLTLPQPTKPVSRSLMAQATAALRPLFHAQAMIPGRPFTDLRGPNVTHYDADGRRDIVAVVRETTIVFDGKIVDFTITDAPGNVVRDSRTRPCHLRASSNWPLWASRPPFARTLKRRSRWRSGVSNQKGASTNPPCA
jgi:hypothetical protein